MLVRSRLARSIVRFPAVVAWAGILVTSLVLLGWVLRIQALQGLVPGLPTMKPNTAIGLMLASASLGLSIRSSSGPRRIPARLLAVSLILLAGVTLAEHGLAWNPGIDSAFLRLIGQSVATELSVRMSVSTGVGLTLLGFSLLTFPSGFSRTTAALAGCLNLLSLLGYLYGLGSLIAVIPFSSGSLITAATMFLLSGALLVATDPAGLADVIAGPTAGGVMARRLLPAALVVPIVLGGIVHMGEQAGLYDVTFRLALNAVGNVATFVVLVLVQSRRLFVIDLERVRAHEEVRRLNLGLEDQVEKKTAELRRSLEEMEAFSYTVSHDLRSPLRTLHGFSRILLDEHAGAIPSEARGYLVRLNTGAAQMGVLIDDLLNFFRMGRQGLHDRDIDTNQLVDDVVDNLRQENPDRSLEFEVADLPACRGDPVMLRSVWTNLLANAVKFTRPQVAARIEVGARSEAGKTIYFVRDNGVGFSMEYADTLFGVFHRLHRAEDFEGTGVGLAIVKRVVERHGGKVWAEAREGEGATFSFSLGGNNGANG